MKTTPWLTMVCCAVVLASNSGCLFTRHTTNIVRKNEKSREVTYESPQAKNIFEGKLAESRTNLGNNFSNPRIIAVPFVLWYSSTDIVSDTGVRNDQLAICDANGDSVITNDEAAYYATRVDELVAKAKAEKAKTDAQMANNAPPATQNNNVVPNNNVAPTYSQPSYTTTPVSTQESLEARGPGAPMPPGNYR
jgi:hypothetical protein